MRTIGLAITVAAALVFDLPIGGAIAGVEAARPALPFETSLVQPSAMLMPGEAVKPSANDQSSADDEVTPTFSTGVFVAKGRLIADALSVEGCEKVQLSRAGSNGEGRVMARDDDHRLALIQTTLPSGPVAPLNLDPHKGETVSVFAIAINFVLTSSGNFSQGRLVQVDPDTSRLLIGAPIVPQSWGGPVLDQSGNLLGIVSAGVPARGGEEILDGKGATVSDSSAIAGFLRQHGVAFSKGKTGAVLDPSDLAAQAKSMSASILCVVNR